MRGMHEITTDSLFLSGQPLPVTPSDYDGDLNSKWKIRTKNWRLQELA